MRPPRHDAIPDRLALRRTQATMVGAATMTTTDVHVAAQANEALTQALISAAARGIRPRCGDYETSLLWLSELDGQRKQAAIMCRGCVVWAECDEVGQHQRFGVFGGVDTTRPANGKTPGGG